MKTPLPKPARRLLFLIPLGALALLAAVMLSVSIGTADIPLPTVWSVLVSKVTPGLVEQSWSAGRESIVWDLRLPRALLAVLVGAGLAMAGAMMQGVTRNPLADPHLLGVSAGAALGANIAILVTGDILGPLTVPLFAFAGALAATGLVIGVATFARATGASRLVLAGIAVSFVITALTSLLTIKADPRTLVSVVFWMLGGLGLSQWSHLAFPAGALLLAGALFMAKAKILNALAMGDETATTLGVAVGFERLVLLVVNAFLTGILVAFSGMIGFIGLMMPHIARFLVGGDNRAVLPVAAMLGAVFLVLCDVAARVLTAPNELPVGIVTGIIGGGFFIALLRR